MKLTEYLNETGIPLKKFSKKIGVSYATLYNLMEGRDVRGSTLVKIQEATNNKVSPKEIYYELIDKKTQ